MANFKLTQTGAELQAAVNRAENATILYKHEIKFKNGSTVMCTMWLITTESTALTSSTLDDFVLNPANIIYAYCQGIFGGNPTAILPILSFYKNSNFSIVPCMLYFDTTSNSWSFSSAGSTYPPTSSFTVEDIVTAL